MQRSHAKPQPSTCLLVPFPLPSGIASPLPSLPLPPRFHARARAHAQTPLCPRSAPSPPPPPPPSAHAPACHRCHPPTSNAPRTPSLKIARPHPHRCHRPCGRTRAHTRPATSRSLHGRVAPPPLPWRRPRVGTWVRPPSITHPGSRAPVARRQPPSRACVRACPPFRRRSWPAQPRPSLPTPAAASACTRGSPPRLVQPRHTTPPPCRCPRAGGKRVPFPHRFPFPPARCLGCRPRPRAAPLRPTPFAPFPLPLNYLIMFVIIIK